MVRPKHDNPTPAELEILKVLWDKGELTVREVMKELNTDRAYTSVMSLLNVMTEKGLLKRKPVGRAFSYSVKKTRQKTLGKMICDVLQRGFEGSPGLLVSHLLDQTRPSKDELDEIRRVIESYKGKTK